MSILSYFPRQFKPRDVQRYALEALEQQWNKANIFVVNLPVASGKSAIAMTLAAWHKQASIITPSKLLVDQYAKEFKRVHILRAKNDYYCSTFKCTIDKRPQSKKTGKLCKKTMGCSGCQLYLSDLRKAHVMPYLLSNYHIYLAHKLYRDLLIVDEAHSLIDTLKSLSAKKLWQFKYKFPDSIKTRQDIKDWVNNLPNSAFNYHYTANGEQKFVPQESLQFLKEEINSYRPTFLIYVDTDKYRGEEHKYIKMEPLDISDETPIMWPSSVRKMVFLSATLSRKDIEQLGLSDKRIQYIQADSPIAAERRPVYIPKTAASLAYRQQDQNLPALIKFITEVGLQNKKEKGLVHATYNLAQKLKNHKWPDFLKDRLLFHGRKDKTIKYNEFRESKEPKILVASGMYEGIDLANDAGRWQIIAKVPWPSLADPAIKFLCQEDEEWYAWETIKTVLQACGRICRTPTDFGTTFIFDKTFERLYNNNIDLFPGWFKHSVHFNTD